MKTLQKLGIGLLALSALVGCSREPPVRGTILSETYKLAPLVVKDNASAAITITEEGKRLLAENRLDFMRGSVLEKSTNGPMPPDVAAQFNDRFYKWFPVFPDAWAAGVTPEYANSFDDRFDMYDIIHLRMANAQPAVVKAYDERFSHNDVGMFIRDGVPPQEANGFPNDCFSHTISDLYKEGARASLSAQLPECDCNDFITVFHRNVDPKAYAALKKAAEDVSPRIDPLTIVDLLEHRISANELGRYSALNERYGVNISADDVIKYKLNAIPFTDVEAAARKEFVEKSVREYR